MKAYKGFHKNMQCRGFQYKESETYETDTAVLCKSGFHACENPIDCLSYYAPADSVYHEVELDDVNDERGSNTKVCAKKIKIGAKIDIAGIVKAAFEYVLERTKSANSTTGNRSSNSTTGDYSANSTTGYCSANSTTGYCSANSTTGDYSANSATGYRSANSAIGYRSANSTIGYNSANSATGNHSANSATGDCSANSTTGVRSANSATGYCSANSATGYCSANSATGYCSANSATGYCSANSATGNSSANSTTGYGSVNMSTGENCSNEGADGTISVGWGKDNKCKGKIGAYIVLCERGEWDGEKYPLIGEPRLAKVDGVTLKPDVWYRLENGKFVECEDET